MATPTSACSSRKPNSDSGTTEGETPPFCLYTDCIPNEPKPMTSNPYVATLLEMGYDEQDCRNVAAAGLQATYPRTIHGRTYQTKAEYDEALAEFLNGI